MTKDRWTAELSIPLSDLNVHQIKDGDQWLVQLSRIWGAVTSWTTLSSSARKLDRPGRGVRLIFREDSPVVQLLNVDPLLHGRAGWKLQLSNPTHERVNLKVSATIVDEKTSKKLWSYTKQIAIDAGMSKIISVDEAVSLSEKNRIRLSVTAKQGQEYFHTDVAFANKLQWPIFPKQIRTSFVFRSRYLPSTNRLWIDAISPGITLGRKVAKALVKVFPKKSPTQVIFSTELDLKTKKRQQNKGFVFSTPLPIGQYQIQCDLLNNKNQTIASETRYFTKGHYPFEGNKVGMTGKVIKPFEPIKVSGDGRDLSMWGRHYRLGDNGLPEQIEALQPEPTVGDKHEKLLQQASQWHVTDKKGIDLLFRHQGIEILKEQSNQVVFQSVSVGEKATVKFKGIVD